MKLKSYWEYRYILDYALFLMSNVPNKKVNQYKYKLVLTLIIVWKYFVQKKIKGILLNKIKNLLFKILSVF